MHKATDKRCTDPREDGEVTQRDYPWQIGLTLVIEEHPTAAEDDRYFGTCTINGTRHHIELIPLTPEWESHSDELALFDGADGPYHTITDRHGTAYVCAITPYCG